MIKQPVKWAIAFLLGLVALPVVAYIWAYSGHFPVAAASRPLPFEVSLANTALHYASHRQAPHEVPVVPSAENLTAAAKLYVTECAFCHGLANQSKPNAAVGMFPPPPQFFTKVDDDPAGVIFWRIKNGIRLTGMPAFAPTLTDEQIWQEALFLQRVKTLPPLARSALATAEPLAH
ncbi:MAG: c-type cytochrome [Terriglobales bacterium]